MASNDLPTDLALPDLPHAAEIALLNDRWAAHTCALAQRRLGELVLLAEGEIEDPAYQNRALDAILQVQKHIVALAESLRELSAQHGALVTTAHALVEQRDQALRRLSTLYEDLAGQMAEAQGCSLEQARTLLYTLASSDDDVMASDYCNLESLIIFRDGLQVLLEQLGYPDEA